MKSKDLMRSFGVLLLAVGLAGCNQGAAPSSGFEVALQSAHSAAFSDDGKFVVIGSLAHGASLWRLHDRERLFDWNHRQGESTIVTAADFSPDGQWALTTDSQTLVLWNVEDGSANRFWNAPGRVLSVSLSQDGSFALLGLSDQSAVLFDVKRGGVKRVLRHEGGVNSVELSRDLRFALTGSDDDRAILWDLDTGEPRQQVSHDDDVQLVALSADGKRAFSAAKYDKALVWSTEDSSIRSEIPLRADKLRRGLRFTSARFSPDGKTLLTGLPDRIVQLWDSESLQALGKWSLPKRKAWRPTGAAVLALGFSQQNNMYFAAASTGFVHQLDKPALPGLVDGK